MKTFNCVVAPIVRSKSVSGGLEIVDGCQSCRKNFSLDLAANFAEGDEVIVVRKSDLEDLGLTFSRSTK